MALLALNGKFNIVMKKKRYRLFLGNVINLNFDDQDRGACPVCGFILEGVYPYYPWSEHATKQADADPQHPSTIKKDEDAELLIASGSFDICPICKTQFGETDFLDNSSNLSQHDLWYQLRQNWLKNVVVNAVIRSQLSNVGVEVCENGNQISDVNLE